MKLWRPEETEAIRKLRVAGVGWAEIASQYGVTIASAEHAAKQYRPQEERKVAIGPRDWPKGIV